MNIQALFLDIDGTLLNSHQLISARTKQRLLAFQKRGGRIVLSSARPYMGMKPYGDQLHLPEYGGYYMAFNGGQMIHAATLESIVPKTFTAQQVVDLCSLVKRIESESLERGLSAAYPDRIIQGKLTVGDAWNIHQVMMQNSLNIITYQEDTVIAMRLEVYAAAEAIVNHMKFAVDPDLFRLLHLETVKFLISGDPALIQKIHPAVKSGLSGCEIVTSDPFLIEVTPQGIHKGNSLQVLLKRLNIPVSESAAIGDSENDLSMIQSAGIGVAMGNAPHQIQQAADFVTSTNDEDGIVRFLDRFQI